MGNEISPGVWQIATLPEGVTLRRREKREGRRGTLEEDKWVYVGWKKVKVKGWQEGSTGGGSGGGRTPGRRTIHRVQGGDDGERSQDRDSFDFEQEKPGGTQATALMAAHGGAVGGRSHGGSRADDSREPTDGGGGSSWSTGGGAGGPMGDGGDEGAGSRDRAIPPHKG